MTSESFNQLITGASAFCGALSAIGFFGFWLASKFNDIYKQMEKRFSIVADAMHEHEIKDMERFSELKLEIQDNRIQAQTIEAVKHH